MVRVFPVVLVGLLISTSSIAEEGDNHVQMVFGGIPLCGDPAVAEEFLTPEHAQEREKFKRQWNDGKDGPDGITEIKITDPHIPLKVKNQDPANLFVFIREDRVHAVQARWNSKGTVIGIKKRLSELEMKVRSSLGEPDDIVETQDSSGYHSEVEYVWHRDHRIVRVFVNYRKFGTYVAVETTCTDSLRETMGEENVF